MVEHSDYKIAFMAAVDYIESHLEEDLKVSTVAREVGYSVYHFHRMFRASMGESIAEYIRKRRLAKASQLLKNSEQSIYHIALASSFDSQESFTRAFKKMFGVTPGKFRKGRMNIPEALYSSFSIELLEHLNEGITMEPVFRERQHDLAVGMGASFGKDPHQDIARLWTQFEPRMHEIKNMVSGYTFGICLEEHPDIAIQEGDSFIYLAAAPVTSFEDIPEGMFACEIPANRYAVFTHKGSIDKITHTVNYIWGTWVPRNTDIIKKDPDFEYYDERFNVDTLDGEVDIYVPVNSKP